MKLKTQSSIVTGGASEIRLTLAEADGRFPECSLRSQTI
jgi:hypothetical protein